jgi:ABC-type antimicrobial peptide transport system permease subunit
MRRAVRSVDPSLPIHDTTMMADVVEGSIALERVGSLMTGFFALAALLLATLGVYALVSYSVRQRTVEIGTRMALGAEPRSVFAMVIGGGLRMAAAGIAAGAAAVGAAVWLLSRSFDLHDVGWVPFAIAIAITAGVAAAASWFPAWRATRLSPLAAMRDL